VGILPTVTLDSEAPSVGADVTATGIGFTPGMPITVAVDGVPVTTDPSPTLSDDGGGFSARLTIPAGLPGLHVLSFSYDVGTVEVPYEIPPAALTISPEVGAIRSRVTITGVRFAADSAISITYVSDALGSFQAGIIVPAGRSGSYTIAAADAAGNSAQATFQIESDAPSPPTLVRPAHLSRTGTYGPERPTFSWSAVSDPSGVTYTIEISADGTFTRPLIRRAGLTSPVYMLGPDEALDRGIYYWRVMATDGASNNSNWSHVSVLTVGILPAWMPVWLLLLVAVVALGLIGGLVYQVLSMRSAR
jgi:hypothetical protein